MTLKMVYFETYHKAEWLCVSITCTKVDFIDGDLFIIPYDSTKGEWWECLRNIRIETIQSL